MDLTDSKEPVNPAEPISLSEERAKRFKGKRLVVQRASDIKQTAVEWIWRNRVALGKMTLFAGAPSVGKTQTTIDIIARITRGMEWPDGGKAPSGSAIIISAEDSGEDVICPRLEFAGADLKRVVIVDAVEEGERTRTMNLEKDLELLEAKVREMGDVGVIQIDPITAYLGDADGHRTTDVRSVLEPFNRFANRHKVAILAITHPPKVSTKAMNSFTGSMAFVAAARLAFFSAHEAPKSERRLFLPVKNNLGPLAEGVGYSILGGKTSVGIETSAIRWDSKPVRLTADEVMGEAEVKDSELCRAENFLQATLEDGPVSADEVTESAKAENFSEATLRRAKKSLEIKSNKYRNEWCWELPKF